MIAAEQLKHARLSHLATRLTANRAWLGSWVATKTKVKRPGGSRLANAEPPSTLSLVL